MRAGRRQTGWELRLGGGLSRLLTSTYEAVSKRYMRTQTSLPYLPLNL